MADAARANGQSRNNLKLTLAASVIGYQLFQQPDGRAAILNQSDGESSGTVIKPSSADVFIVTKSTAVAFLDGDPAYWDHSALCLIAWPNNDRDFYAGTIVGNAAIGDTTATLNLNERTAYESELRAGYWISEATNGLGAALEIGGTVTLSFDAVNEQAQAAVYFGSTRSVDANAIFDCVLTLLDNGNSAALDIDVGLASGSHATDFEAVATFAAFHVDGNSLALLVHSDDGTTDVPPTATAVSLVIGTPVHLKIDARDKDAIKFYVNGVRVAAGTAFPWTAATNEVRPIAMMEKTADATPGQIRLTDMSMRTAQQ